MVSMPETRDYAKLGKTTWRATVWLDNHNGST